jgi:hypothetical protein
MVPTFKNPEKTKTKTKTKNNMFVERDLLKLRF